MKGKSSQDRELFDFNQRGLLFKELLLKPHGQCGIRGTVPKRPKEDKVLDLGVESVELSRLQDRLPTKL